MDFLNIKISSIVLPQESSLRRDMPRKKEDRQYNYETLFDSRTLFSDVFFRKNGDIELLGPPLLNLQQPFLEGKVLVDLEDVTSRLHIEETDRISRVLIEGCGNVSTVRINLGEECFEVPIQQNESSFFKDKNVLITQQKDNPLEWIMYWVLYHIEHHKIDSVLIYDNGSSKYSIDELQNSLSKIDKLDKVCIIGWDIPWGPTGGHASIWDSDYGQHQSWEHALYRMVNEANVVIIDDIDELPIHNCGVAIPDLFTGNEHAVIAFKRRNIIDVGLDSNPRIHSNTWMFNPDEPLISTKYAIKPDRLSAKTQLLAHRVLHNKIFDYQELIIRHFTALRMDWRNGKFEIKPLRSMESFPKIEEDVTLRNSFHTVNKTFLDLF